MTEARPITDGQVLIAYPLIVQQQQLRAQLLGIEQGISALIQSYWGEPAHGLVLDIEARQITKEITPNEAADRLKEIRSGNENRGASVPEAANGHGEDGEGAPGTGEPNGGTPRVDRGRRRANDPNARTG